MIPAAFTLGSGYMKIAKIKTIQHRKKPNENEVFRYVVDNKTIILNCSFSGKKTISEILLERANKHL